MEIYTDGSHSLKPRMSGVGVVIIDNGNQHQLGYASNKCENNNVAEVLAIAYAIKYIQEYKLDEKTKDKNIVIFSDSAYALRKIRQQSEGMDDYEQKLLDNIQAFIYSSKKNVTFFQVKGHIHDGTKVSRYNNLADEIAYEYRCKGLLYYQSKLAKKMRKNKKNYNNFDVVFHKKSFEKE